MLKAKRLFFALLCGLTSVGLVAQNPCENQPEPDQEYTLITTGIPAYSYTSIVNTGTLLGQSDDGASTYSLQHPIILYGAMFTDLRVSPNGYVTTDLTDTGGDLTNDCPVPSNASTGSGDGRFYVLHDDLDMGNGDPANEGIYVQYNMPAIYPHAADDEMGAHVIQWFGDHFGGSEAGIEVDFQAVFYDNGDVLYIYNQDNEGGSGSTIGWQESNTGPDAATIVCNTANSVSPGTTFAISAHGTDDFSDDVAACSLLPPGVEEVNLAAITTVNITLNEACRAMVIPSQVLSGDFDVDDNGIIPADNAFNLVVLDENPDNGPIVDGCGTWQWTVTADPEQIAGLTTAWGFLNAEDKTSPVLSDSLEAPDPLYCDEVEDIDISLLPGNVSRCWIQSGEDGSTLFGSMNPLLRQRLLAGGGIPNFLDNCSNVEICVNDVVLNNGACEDVVLTRTFTVVDGLDCTSESGEENAPTVYSYDITFIRPTIEDVVGVPADAIFNCDDSFPVLPPNQFGQVNPAPQPGDFPFFPGPDGPIFLGDNFCNIGSTFEDGPQIQTCPQTFKVVRTYTVIDWCQPDVVRTFTQLVKVGDFEAPDITTPTQDLNFDGQPDDGPLFFSTSNPDCSANFIVPAGSATDNCDPNPEVFALVYPFQDTEAPAFGPFQVGGGAFEIPEGLHTLRYIARDACDNADTLDVPLLIEDRTAPVAICEDGLDISLGGAGSAILTPDDIDRASYDECSDVTLLIAFVGSNNQPLSDAQTFALTGIAQGGWRESINLTCQILDDDPDSQDFVAVGLLVTDEEGNSNTCWLDVLVEDKLPPLCVAPGPETVLCNDPDVATLPQDLNAAFADDPVGVGAQLDALFGAANGIDNCPIDDIEQAVQDTRNSCGVGAIIRTFVVTDAEGFTSSNNCIQFISVLGIHDYSIVFPADFGSEDCIEPDYNGVDFEERGCDLLTTTTSIDTFLATADECYKLRVTYEVLNWCEYGTEAGPYVIPRDADNDNILEEVTWLHVLPNDESTLSDDVAWLDRDGNRFNGFISPLDDDNPNGQVPGSSSQPYGTDESRGAYLYRQFIKVYDDTPPAVANETEDLVFEDQDGTCAEPVVLTISVDDACTSPDDYTASAELDPFFMDIDGDGLLTLADFVPTSDPVLAPNAVNNGDGTFTVSFNVDLPIGRHAVRFRATDGCGNAETILVIFEVIDDKA
ncbi:MAG: hypothetical protein AAFY91_05610, partial [Bacteroidota bacterium]